MTLKKFQKLFTEDTDTQVLMSLEDLELDSEPNIELVKMVSSKTGPEVEDEIASQLFPLTRNLKRNKHTKQLDDKKAQQQQSTNNAQYAKRVTFLLKNNYYHKKYRKSFDDQYF